MFVVDKNTVRGVIDILGLVLFYGFVFWRIFKGNRGNKVIECGSITLIVFVVLLALAKVPNLPVWVSGWLAVLLFLLCLITMFFLAQQGYRALRRRKTG